MRNVITGQWERRDSIDRLVEKTMVGEFTIAVVEHTGLSRAIYEASIRYMDAPMPIGSFQYSSPDDAIVTMRVFEWAADTVSAWLQYLHRNQWKMTPGDLDRLRDNARLTYPGVPRAEVVVRPQFQPPPPISDPSKAELKETMVAFAKKMSMDWSPMMTDVPAEEDDLPSRTRFTELELDDD